MCTRYIILINKAPASTIRPAILDRRLGRADKLTANCRLHQLSYLNRRPFTAIHRHIAYWLDAGDAPVVK